MWPHLHGLEEDGHNQDQRFDDDPVEVGLAPSSPGRLTRPKSVPSPPPSTPGALDDDEELSILLTSRRPTRMRKSEAR